MTQPADITDPALAKALAHPLRIQILGLLENRVASPAQIAAELGSSLSLTAYHVRKLNDLGLVQLVERQQHRGAVAHYYTAAVRPRFSDATWDAIPSFVKRAFIGERITQAGADAGAAAERGGFEREGVHVSRTRLRLPVRAWQALSHEFEQVLERIEAMRVAEQEGPADDPEAHYVEATALLMLFESPPPDSFTLDATGHAPDDEELEGRVPG
jgi:DNA-binding transcriptional ArsR family regulator